MLNQSYAIKILTVGDFDCTQRSLQTMNSILSYLSQNKVDRFVFLGDVDYRNHIDLRDSYSVCGQHFLEQASKYTELRMIREIMKTIQHGKISQTIFMYQTISGMRKLTMSYWWA